MKYILKNVTAITFDKNNPLLKGVDILINDDKIAEIGKIDNSELESYDMSNTIVLPGIINAHMHFYSTLGRGLSLPGTPPANFVEVLEKFWWKLDHELTEKELYYSVIFPIIEGIKHGTTTVFDHHVSTKFIEGSLSEIKKIMDKYNIKGTLSFEVTNRNGEDVFKREVKENNDFFEKNRGKNIQGMLGLHANLTLSDDDLRYMADNTPEDLPIHCHLAEDKADEDTVKDLGYKNATIRLEKFKLLRNHSLLIHGVWADESEWELIKKHHSFMVHNPSSNLNNAVGIFDLVKAINSGITVGIGTDGMHNIPLKEYQLAYYLTHIKNNLPSYGWNEAYKAITNNSIIAQSIMGKQIGMVKKGYFADFAVFDYVPPTEINTNNFIGHLLFGIINSRVIHTIANGKFFMKDYKLQLNIDENEISQKSLEVAKEFWKRLK